MLSEKQDHRGNNICIGYPMTLDYRAKSLNFKLCHDCNCYPTMDADMNQTIQTYIDS